MQLINNPQLYKKFSIGLSLETTLEEYKQLLDVFGIYIYDIFFSLPLGNDHHSRRQTAYEFSKEGAKDQFISILRLMKENGIKLEAALNTPMLNKNLVLEAFDYLQNYIDFDSIVTLKDYGQMAKERFPQKQLVYSYNNEIRTKEHVDSVPPVFNEVVIGNSCIRDLQLLSYIKLKGFKNKLLVNNGCSFNCYWCNKPGTCKPIFYRNLEQYSAEELYALQSIFPWELHKYILNKVEIDRIKISSRPSGYDFISNCLYGYISNNDHELSKRPGYYNLWGRLGHFVSYYDSFDFDRINAIKEKIWSGQKVFGF